MKKRIATILLLALLCTLLCPAAFAGTPEDTTLSGEATGPVESFLDRCEELAEAAEEGEKKIALSLYEDLRQELNALMDEISLSQAQGVELSDSALADYESCREAFLSAAHALTEGELRQALKDTISEEEFAYLEQFSALTPKQSILEQKEESLAEKYLATLNNAAKKASATLNGKTYTYEKLQEDLPEGMTEEERSALLEQCRSKMADSCAESFIQLITARRELAKETDAASYDELVDTRKGRTVSREDLQTLYRTVKECSSDVLFSGTAIPCGDRDITAEEFLEDFTAAVQEASPLAAEALQYLKDTGSCVITESESASGESALAYLHSDDQEGLLSLSLGKKTNAGFLTFARLLGAFTGIHASGGIDNFQLPQEDRVAFCGACLAALMTAHYDSVLKDTDVAVLTNNLVTQLKNQLRRGCLIDEWERYLYSDAPLTKEGLIEEYDRLREAYGLNGTGYDGMLNSGIVRSPMSMLTSALSSFYALQVWNQAMTHPAAATEMFEKLCSSMKDENCKETLSEAGFVFFTDEDGIRETIKQAGENYEVLHQYASVMNSLRDNGVELELDEDLPETLAVLKQAKPYIEQLLNLFARLEDAELPELSSFGASA